MAANSHLSYEEKVAKRAKALLSVGISRNLVEFTESLTSETFEAFPFDDSDVQKRKDKTILDYQQLHARRILMVSPNLRSLYNSLCPSVMTEDRFWSIYFLLVQNKIEFTGEAPPPPPPNVMTTPMRTENNNGNSNSNNNNNNDGNSTLAAIQATVAASPFLSKIYEKISNVAASASSSSSSAFSSDSFNSPSALADSAEQEQLALGITPSLLDFVRNLCSNPEIFTSFPVENSNGNPEVVAGLTKKQVKHAKAMLNLLPELSQLRFQICPSKMLEGRFWYVYFALVEQQARKHLAWSALLPKHHVDNAEMSKNVAYGITPLFKEWVNGLTAGTFTDFPLTDEMKLEANEQFSNLNEAKITHFKLILKASPHLNQLRLNLVPSFMTEELFCVIYFALAMDKIEVDDKSIFLVTKPNSQPSTPSLSSTIPQPSNYDGNNSSNSNNSSNINNNATPTKPISSSSSSSTTTTTTTKTTKTTPSRDLDAEFEALWESGLDELESDKDLNS